MDVITNTFCAGGGVLGNGTWINVGGNNAVGAGGLNHPINSSHFPLSSIFYIGIPLPDDQQNSGAGPYQVHDGGLAIRFINPCDDQGCNWIDDPKLYM